MRAIAKYDWAKVRAEYISSSISLRDIAEKHSIPFPTVRDRAKKEQWTAEREKFVTKTVRKTTERISSRIAKSLEKEYDIADKLADVLARALADDQQFNRHLVEKRIKMPMQMQETNSRGAIVTKTAYMEKQEVVENIYEKMDMAAISQAAKTLQAVETVKRRIRGILTEPEKRKINIEERKLAMDEKNSGMGADFEENTGVVILPIVLPEPEPPEDGGGDD